MLFTTKWLASIYKQSRAENLPLKSIECVMTDSRKASKQALFIPIVGDQHDGHQYLEQAIQNGAVATFWEKDRALPHFLAKDFPVLYVDNTLQALQKLASTYREKIDPVVIGITGSNGKTTTKDIVASVLKTTYRTHATKGNFNNHIGLPLTILSMRPDTEVLVLEMGMNHFGEIDLLSKLAMPDYGIVTNIGESHIEHLGSREGIKRAKLELMNGLKDNGVLIIDGDEPMLENIPTKRNLTMIRCGFHSSNDYVITDVHFTKSKTNFTINGERMYQIPLLGHHHAKNAAYAISLGERLEVANEEIGKGLKALEHTGMRFELIKGKNNVSIINDAYNASPTSMKAAIDVVKDMKGYEEKVLVLGDIFELGEHSERLHRSVATIIDDSITALYTYGEMAKYITEEINKGPFRGRVNHFDHKDELIDQLALNHMRDTTLILFKASRGMQFETIVKPFI